MVVRWTAFRGAGTKGLAEKKQFSTHSYRQQSPEHSLCRQIAYGHMHLGLQALCQVRCAAVESWPVYILTEVVWSGLRLHIFSQHPPCWPKPALKSVGLPGL